MTKKPFKGVIKLDMASGDMKTQIGKFTLSGDGLCVGFDSGDAVSEEYKSPGRFKGGTIFVVGVTWRRRNISTWRSTPPPHSQSTERAVRP